jgi:hypothetical protein
MMLLRHVFRLLADLCLAAATYRYGRPAGMSGPPSGGKDLPGGTPRSDPRHDTEARFPWDRSLAGGFVTGYIRPL